MCVYHARVYHARGEGGGGRRSWCGAYQDVIHRVRLELSYFEPRFVHGLWDQVRDRVRAGRFLLCQETLPTPRRQLVSALLHEALAQHTRDSRGSEDGG